jgi:hypothetical protein
MTRCNLIKIIMEINKKIFNLKDNYRNNLLDN